MEYKVVESHSSDDLAEQVNVLLKDDWELRGELIASCSQLGDGYRDYFFAQVLVRLW
jgi:hypothetical protein